MMREIFRPPDERHYESPIVRFGVGLFGIACLIIAPIAAWSTIGSFLDARESRDWPKAIGTVVESRVEKEHSSLTKRFFWPRVVYQYAVENRPYIGKRVSHYDIGYASEKTAAAIIAQYPLNRQVQVSYRPGDAGDAVLEAGLGWRSYAALGIGPLMLGFGILSLWSVRALGQRYRARLLP